MEVKKTVNKKIKRNIKKNIIQLNEISEPI